MSVSGEKGGKKGGGGEATGKPLEVSVENHWCLIQPLF